ncbi:hypothetical protein BO71DRAFT_3974 [Aspergillus ellipticus CBS 707.79]|uniref:Secreted protein n=1 Tax=Aspergillus ellipticus CBS 707.79 TaxID=1448320 RepID=A0A319D738_9EURO|nr:hypothetical protein BO71DRAFT_3974 [Aspergillus ellipticus CBS 707.79]
MTQLLLALLARKSSGLSFVLFCVLAMRRMPKTPVPFPALIDQCRLSDITLLYLAQRFCSSIYGWSIHFDSPLEHLFSFLRAPGHGPSRLLSLLSGWQVLRFQPQKAFDCMYLI